MSDSISRRFSSLLGVGEISYKWVAKLAVKDQSKEEYDNLTHIASYTLSRCRGLACAELPLPLKLRELCLLCENLISTLLHFASPLRPSQEQAPDS